MTEKQMPANNNEATDLNKNTPTKRSWKRLIIGFVVMAICLAVFFGIVFGFHAFIKSKGSQIMSTYKRPPTEISTAKATSQKWTPYIDAIGSATAVKSIAVSAQVTGTVSKIYFKSGEMVTKGQKLFDLDTAQLKATLKQNIASMALTDITFKRDTELFAKNAISQSQLDTSKAQYQEAKAVVEGTQAQITYHRVTAPFSGKIGIRDISVGDFFQAGATAATLDTISPIFIDFTIPGNQISSAHANQKVEAFADAYKNDVFKGTVSALDSRVASDTRSLTIRAKFSNKSIKIFPGMFMTVHLMLPVKENVVSVPQSAINYTLYGDTVYTLTPVTDKNGKQVMASYNDPSNPSKILVTDKKLYTAHLTTVKVGQLNGSEAEINSGLKAGQTIVTSGQLKLKDGAEVVINNTYMLKL